jgi:hypothetical protein
MRPFIEDAFNEYSDGPPVATQPIHVWIDFHDATDVHWRNGSRIYGRPDRYELTVGRDKAKHHKSFCPACRGERWKLRLTVNVSQGGRLVGWMSSGLRCRLINPFSDLKCKWVRFHKGSGA